MTVGSDALSAVTADDAIRVTHGLGEPLFGLGEAVALVADVLSPVAYEDDPDAYRASCSPDTVSGEVAVWQTGGPLIVALTPVCGEFLAGYPRHPD